MLQYKLIDIHNYKSKFGLTKQDVLAGLYYAIKTKGKKLSPANTEKVFNAIVSTLGIHPIIAASFIKATFNIDVPEMKAYCKGNSIQYFSDLIHTNQKPSLLKKYFDLSTSRLGTKLSSVLDVIE